MAPVYRVDLEDTTGAVVAQFNHFISLNVEILWNDKGNYQFLLSGFDKRYLLFKPDYRVRVWMQDIAEGIDWLNIFTGIHKTMVKSLSEGGQRGFTSYGPSPEELLDKEAVLWYAGSPQSEKAGIATSIMYEYALENIGAGALVANGRLDDGLVPGLSMGGDPVLGPTWEGARAYKNLLEVMRDIANFTFYQADPIDFRISPLGGYLWQFQAGRLSTDRTTRGLDKTTGKNAAGNVPVVFSETRDNIERTTRSKSRYNEANVVIALGEGEEEDRLYAIAKDVPSIAASPVARRVHVLNATNEKTEAALLARAQGELQRLKATDKFVFVPRKAGQVLFRDYFPGDFITGEDEGTEFHSRIVKCTINVSGASNQVERITLDYQDI